MKVLFLDVDGVLNSSRSRSIRALSRGALRRLSRVVDATGCMIVVSSTWRLHPEFLTLLRRRLAHRNIHIIGITDKLMDGHDRPVERGVEIHQWMIDHPGVTAYAILDDTDEMLRYQRQFFVQTNMAVGMTDEDAEKAISILGGV